MNKSTERPEYCAFILWGNGFAHAPEIIEEIRAHPEIEIQKVFLHHTDNIHTFIKDVYARDDVPKAHLKEKVRYLKRLGDPNVVIVLAKNNNPQEFFRGRDEFRHLESHTLKTLKESLRDRFNPRKRGGTRTEEHIIHATDSRHQLDHLMRLLGFSDGIAHFDRTPNTILPVPHYIRPFTHFTIVRIPIEHLYCRIITGTQRAFGSEIVPIAESPHYAFLTGKKARYQEYVKEFSGLALTEDYSPKKFEELAEGFLYLAAPEETSYILTSEFQLDRYVIHDGLHRAAILKARGEKEIPVAIMRGATDS